MRLKFLLYPLCFFLLASCDNLSQNQKLEDFEFYISSFDNSGLIQLPDIINDEKVIDILVTNKPKGTYEIFRVDLEGSSHMNYIHYEAPSDTLSADEVHFILSTANDRSVAVTAKLSPIRDGHCQGSDTKKDYNFLLQNHDLSIGVGNGFKIQIDGFNNDFKASDSLLPGCDITQDFGFRTTLLLELGENKIFPESDCCSYDHDSFNPLSIEDGIGFSHDTKDGPLFISGVIPMDVIPGTYKVVYGVLIHKLSDGSSLPNFKLYPAATWEWSEQLTVHKYGVITFEIAP